MARINIEDSLFKDGRWIKLIIKTGCEYKALGILTRAWILSQEHWLKYKSVPKKAWPNELNVLIETELAITQADGSVYIKGSKKAFSWLEQRIHAGAIGGSATSEKKAAAAKENAKKGGRPKKEQVDSKSNIQHEEPKQNQAKPSKTKPLTLSLSPSLSLFSDSNSNSVSNTSCESATLFSPESPKPKKKVDPAATELNKRIWQSYEDAYLIRYKEKPTRNATVNGQISNLGKRLGDEAASVIAFYVGHNDGFYVKKCHSVGQCLSDAEALRTQWARNIQVTGTKVRQFEKINSQVELMQDADKGGF